MAPSDSYDEYWQLDDYKDTTSYSLRNSLKKKGYWVPSAALKADIVKMQHLVDRGLLCYEKCSNAELQTFVTDRKIVGTTPRDHIALTVEALKRADSELEFPRFRELPAELRIRVYHYYVSEFGDVLTTPAQPPLSRTCKQLRNEVLPVFYASHGVQLTFQCSDTQSNIFRPDDTTMLFLLNLAPENLAELRRIRIRIIKKGRGIYLIDVTLFGDETAAEHDITTDSSKSYNVPGMPTVKATVANLEAGFAMVLDGVCLKEGRKKLVLSDVYKLRKAIENVFT